MVVSPGQNLEISASWQIDTEYQNDHDSYTVYMLSALQEINTEYETEDCQ